MRASISNAVATDDYILYMTLANDNEMEFDFKQVFEYPRFKTLKDVNKWKAIQVNGYSLSWGEGSSMVELSLDELLYYFA
ncbi:MAG: hypothetical protein K0R09_621 [Clostridiales bacterium]|jgi:hypothetical protein|nr:hypothetical protein [Clostridiales bacterium]